MKRFSFSSAILGLMGCAALALTATTPAHAGFVVGGENGWQFSVDGMINVFMVRCEGPVAVQRRYDKSSVSVQ